MSSSTDHPANDSSTDPYVELRIIRPTPSPKAPPPEPDQSSTVVLALVMLIVAIVFSMVGSMRSPNRPEDESLPVPFPPTSGAIDPNLGQGGTSSPVFSPRNSAINPAINPAIDNDWPMADAYPLDGDGEAGNRASLSTAGPLAQAELIQIGRCNGQWFDGANFRDRPTLDDSSIVGIVLTDERVELTGQTRRVGNVEWYQVVNLTPLAPSAVRPRPYQQLREGQIGWIAGCFLSEPERSDQALSDQALSDQALSDQALSEPECFEEEWCPACPYSIANGANCVYRATLRANTTAAR